jgi:hypothetical protein
MAMSLDELAIAFRLLVRIEVFALDVLDQRDFGRRRIVDLADNCRDRVQARALRSSPATLASDDLKPSIAVRTEKDRLQDTALGDRIGELIDRFFPELDARLFRVGPDATDLDLANAA